MNAKRKREFGFMSLVINWIEQMTLTRDLQNPIERRDKAKSFRHKVRRQDGD